MVTLKAPEGQLSVAGSSVFVWRPAKFARMCFLSPWLVLTACLENVVCLECIQALDRGRLLEVLSGQLSFA